MTDKPHERPTEQRDPVLGRDGYIGQLVDLLFERLREVVRFREPEVEACLLDERPLQGLPPALQQRVLQAYGLWFQLAAIAEENAAMRARRRIERDGGPDAVPGSFSHVIARAAAAGVEAGAVQDLLDRSLIQPVLTAHPTEAKRVTVLDIHKRRWRSWLAVARSRSGWSRRASCAAGCAAFSQCRPMSW